MRARILATLISVLLFSSYASANFFLDGLFWRESISKRHNDKVWMKIFEPVANNSREDLANAGEKLVFLIVPKAYDIGSIWCDREKSGQCPKTELMFAAQGLRVFQTYLEGKEDGSERICMQNAFFDFGREKEHLMVTRISLEKDYDGSKFLSTLKESKIVRGEFLLSGDGEVVTILLPKSRQSNFFEYFSWKDGAMILLGTALYLLPSLFAN